jgi:hypothetical protein
MTMVNKPFGDIITFTRSSTGTYFDANGMLQVAAVNQPRFDHDPVTGAPLGILIEEQRTNLLTYSNDFANAVWTKLASTVVANAVLSPDGTLTASKLQEDSSLSNHTLGRSVMPTAGQAYTYSGFVKAAERGFVMAGFVGGGISTAPLHRCKPLHWSRYSCEWVAYILLRNKCWEWLVEGFRNSDCC